MHRPVLLASLIGALSAPTSAPAYLFWKAPIFASGAVTGTEPDMVLPLAKATPAEIRANLVWSLRAGLNVAALQCQFAPGLMSVRYYNDILRYHTAELQASYKVLDSYFRRTAKKTWQTDLDSYTTRTYNGFTSFHGQLGFCDIAARIARDAMTRSRGQFYRVAETDMRELRNAQTVPLGDTAFAFSPGYIPVMLPDDPQCYAYDKKGRRLDCETGKKWKAPRA